MKAHHDANNDNGDTPYDLDALRMRLFRRVGTIEQRWKRCVARSCRRARRCVDHDMICAQALVPAPHQDDAQVMAELRAALDRRMAELGADE